MKTSGRSAAEYVPPNPTIPPLQAASKSCRGCDLCKHATQTVFGEGSIRARVMFVGEQPGDKEDLQGHSFVGPAGRILDKALEESRISRDDLYVTKPEIIVRLGATAAPSLLGRAFRVTMSRGEVLPFPPDRFVVATVHASSILRMRDEESRHATMRDFINDLKQVRAWLDRHVRLKTGT